MGDDDDVNHVDDDIYDADHVVEGDFDDGCQIVHDDAD